MAKPNKTVRNYRRKNPFPQRPPRSDQEARFKRIDEAVKNIFSGKWTHKQGIEYIEKGKISNAR
jgi:hypothetical protein